MRGVRDLRRGWAQAGNEPKTRWHGAAEALKGVSLRVARAGVLGIVGEPTAGLDLSIQGEVLNLLAEIQERTGIAILIITHNLAVVRHISDRTIIMYRGKFVEEGETEAVFRTPSHDDTRRLIVASQHDRA